MCTHTFCLKVTEEYESEEFIIDEIPEPVSSTTIATPDINLDARRKFYSW